MSDAFMLTASEMRAVHDLDDRGVMGESSVVGDERLLTLAQLAQLSLSC